MYDPTVAILAAVEDFLFRSKIRATAKHVNADVRFAQTSEEILAQARELQPTLVIFDLNSQKMDAIATIAALKADAATSALRAIGFASHVHTDLIAAARKAGRTMCCRVRRSPGASRTSCRRARRNPRRSGRDRAGGHS